MRIEEIYFVKKNVDQEKARIIKSRIQGFFKGAVKEALNQMSQKKLQQISKEISGIYLHILVHNEQEKPDLSFDFYGKLKELYILKAFINEEFSNNISEIESKLSDGIKVSCLISSDKLSIKNSIRLDSAEPENLPFIPLNPMFSLDKLIVKPETHKEIEKSIEFFRNIQIVYKEWGFEDIEPNPRVILNFYGPPGTGKTMAAHAIAQALNMKILVLNYADIESKYVGEAPKNLVKAFEIAQKSNALLFFDEADSFLGKRITSVSSSADQAINSLRSQMLILLESFNGIVIFATNLLKNYDPAFETRIFKHIEFPLPDEEIRRQLIQLMIPTKLPLKKQLTEEELAELVRLSEGFSGRDIKNAIREVLIAGLTNKKNYFSFEDFKEGFIDYANTKENANRFAGNSSGFKKTIENKIKWNLHNEKLQNLKSNEVRINYKNRITKRLNFTF